MVTYQQDVSYTGPSKEIGLDCPTSSKTAGGWGDYHEYTKYSPSLLVISNSSTRLSELTQWLEDRSCQVKGVNINSNKLASVAQLYFDLIVVDLEAFEQAICETHEDILKVLQTLALYPGLSLLPTVILTNCTSVKSLINRSATGPVYCLAKDASTEAILLQIMAQVHYLTYRYV
jgi:CheY-like chemotaxis protein